MASLQVDTKVNIFAAVVVLLGVAAGYGQMQGQFATQIEINSNQNATILAINNLIRDQVAARDAESAKKDQRITALEISNAGFSSELRNIQQGVNRIENLVNDMSRKNLGITP